MLLFDSIVIRHIVNHQACVNGTPYNDSILYRFSIIIMLVDFVYYWDSRVKDIMDASLLEFLLFFHHQNLRFRKIDLFVIT